MKKSIGFLLLCCLSVTALAQVKIGHNPTSINPAAILELGNNTAGAANTWKSFLPPQVNFSNAVFTSNGIWGIAGTPTPGAIVYNTAEVFSNGFTGPGLYVWHRGNWIQFDMLVVDKIKASLTTSLAAYNAASPNSWVTITAAEYNALLQNLSTAARYGIPEIYMGTTSNGGWSPNYTVGANVNSALVPASSYIIAWSVRTGNGPSSSSGSKLKISTAPNSGYTDYGSPLPDIGSIAANTRVYFVLKTPSITTPAAPGYIAIYNAITFFLGNNTGAGFGPEYYIQGDLPNPATSFPSNSYMQVIGTTTREW